MIAAEDATAQLLHARGGLDVTLLGGPPDIPVSEAWVDVTEAAVTEHLSKLVRWASMELCLAALRIHRAASRKSILSPNSHAE
jgi:hypothetical protein